MPRQSLHGFTISERNVGDQTPVFIPPLIFVKADITRTTVSYLSAVYRGGMGGRTVESVCKSLRDCGNETIECGFEFAL